MAIRGLGDVVAKATSWLGIRPCPPCERRRETLNRIAPNPFAPAAPPPPQPPPQGKEGPK